MTTSPPGRFPDWDSLYRARPGDTMPWYYADLDPDLAAALHAHLIARGHLLDLGTGPGTQAIELAARGFDVTASDISSAAISRAMQAAAARGVDVNFVQDDVLAPRLGGRFDAVFDRGCFHVMDPAARPTYVANVAAWLDPDGLLFLKTFSKQQPGTEGPYRFTADELRATFATHFELLSCDETVYQGTLDPLPRALFSVLRRR